MARMKKQRVVGGRIVGGPLRRARADHPLQVVLQQLNLTQSDLAFETGVPASTISRVLTGRDKAFTGHQALKIKTFLGDRISADSLVFPVKE